MRQAVKSSIITWILISVISVSIIDHNFEKACQQNNRLNAAAINKKERAFEKFKKKRTVEMEKELIKACGGNEKGLLRYPDYDIQTMLEKLAGFIAEKNECSFRVACDNFTEFVVTFDFKNSLDKNDCSRIAANLLKFHNQYVHELRFLKKGNPEKREANQMYIIDKKSIVRLSKHKEINDRNTLQQLQKI